MDTKTFVSIALISTLAACAGSPGAPPADTSRATLQAAVEPSACIGLSEADRETSPFARRSDIVRVETLRTQPATAKETQVGRLQGASITVRATPGLTPEYLQRIVSCHVARDPAMAATRPELSSSPLSVKGASAMVESAGDAFRIDIKGDSKEASEEIAQRAKELGAGR